MKSKICGICSQEKSIKDFYKRKYGSKDGLHGHCKECQKDMSRDWTIRTIWIGILNTHLSGIQKMLIKCVSIIKNVIEKIGLNGEILEIGIFPIFQ